jgi:hypothetical protein
MRFFRGSVIPVWVGMVVAGLAITIIEFLGSKVYPPPLGMNPEDPASVRAAMALMPLGALLFVLLGWIVGGRRGRRADTRRREAHRTLRRPHGSADRRPGRRHQHRCGQARGKA